VPSPPPLRLRRLLEQSLPPFLRPLLTQPSLLLRLRRAFLMIPQTPTHPSKLQQGDRRIPAPQMRRKRPTCPTLNHTTNLQPRRTLPPDVGDAVEGVTEYELERSCHFPIIFFTPSQRFYTLLRRPVFSYLFVSATYFLDVLYSLHFRVPITCIIVINSLYPITLASGIRYF